jgi:hypothetical protein
MNPLHHAALCTVIALISMGCTPQRKPDPPDVDALVAQLAEPVTDICAHRPALCERACADCPDAAACMKANGVCAAQQDHFIDVRDGGLSPFVPGCHMRYQDAACSVNGAFFDADHCIGDALYEWWQPACHPGFGDMVRIDCRKLCILMHRPGGTCEYIANVCPGNRDSGRCICDPPQEPPIEP